MTSQDAIMLTKALADLTANLVCLTQLLEGIKSELEWVTNSGPAYAVNRELTPEECPF